MFDTNLHGMEYGTWIFLYFLGEAVDVLEIASVNEVNWALEVWICSVQERLCVGLQSRKAEIMSNQIPKVNLLWLYWHSSRRLLKLI